MNKNSPTQLGVGIVIGAVAVVVLLALGARLTEVNIGPLGFNIPTATSLTVSQPTAQPTNTHVTPTNTPALTPTPDLYQFYVDDIKKTVPNASVTADTLKGIASKIPTSISFIAEANAGLIPYQYMGKFIERAGPVYLNAPEGGYAYISWGNGKVKAGNQSVDYRWIEGNVYLVLIIGKLDDGTPTDLNTTLELSDFAVGNVYINFASPAKGQDFRGKFVNKAWLSQQLWWAASNKLITVSILDLSTGNRFTYNVDPLTFA